MKLSPVILGIATAFLVFVIGAFVLLVINDKDTQGIVTLLTATIFPVLLALFNANKNEHTAAAVAKVDQKVNGQVSSLVDLLAAQPALPAADIAAAAAPRHEDQP